MIIQIEVKPEFHNFCKDEKTFINMLESVLQNEMYLGDLHGEIKSVKKISN